MNENNLDIEIKKEFREKFGYENYEKQTILCEKIDDVSDFWLSKFHTLQEEYKKEKDRIVEDTVAMEIDFYKKEIDTKMLAFFANYSIDRPIPPSEIRAYWDNIIK
jgi:hypothetical protein